MDRRFYSRKHFELLAACGSRQAPDAAETIAERVRYRQAAEKAVREREEKYPILTQENAAEAIAWQEKRIQEILKETNP